MAGIGTAVIDVDTRIERGAISALLGPNGSGTTRFTGEVTRPGAEIR